VIKHIVAFKYKPTVTQLQKDEVMNRFLALKQECKRDGKNYIVSLIGGDCTESLEGLTGGFEQAFVVTFNNPDDYKYYAGQPFSSPFDLAHDEFKKFAIPFLSVDEEGKTNGAIVFDFSTPT
jgi:stress responsive alpha/beta barrel protein